MSVSNAYVVGYGMIDALGNTPTQCFNNMVNDYESIRKLDCMGDHKIQYGIPCHHDTLLPEGFAPRKLKTMTRAQELSLHATEQALRHSKLPHSSNVAVIISSCSNDVEALDANYQKLKDNKRVNPFTIVNRIPDMIVGHICTEYQFHGASLALQASCATGMYSIDYAMRILDEYDYVIVGGSDAGVFEMALKYFSSIGALGNKNCPFDDNREGFVMGEGAGVIVLEELEHAKVRGAKIYAEFVGYGLTGDAHHITAPTPDGNGAFRCMAAAIKRSGLGPEDIDYVNAHGTSTMADVIELGAVKRAFGSAVENISMSSTKSAIGHLLGAAGAVESIFSILAIRDGVIPPTLNLDNPDEGCDIDLVPHQAKERSVRAALTNSFGFGGTNASLVFKAYK